MPVEKIGLPAWEARRKAWTEPNQAYLDKRKDAEILTAKYDISFKLEGHRKIVYEQLVRQHRILKEPMPLRHIIPILVTGWQDDGVWPKGEIVQERSD